MISTEESWEGSAENELSCKLEFDNSSSPSIMLEVTSSNSKRASQAFAELEEQLERTLVSSWMYKLNASNLIVWFGALILIAFLAGIMFLPKGADETYKNAIYLLSKDEIESFAKQAKTAATTEDKINFLFAFQTLQLERVGKQPAGTVIRFRDLGKLFTLKTVFIVLPGILIIGCLIYLRMYSYPNGVFAWGDWEDHYNKIMSTRKSIWTVIIAAFFVGVLSNLFVYGLSLR